MINRLRITNLKLINCACFKQIDIKFIDGYNLICGTNGIGKTTILNAIGASFNNSHSVPSIKRRALTNEPGSIKISIDVDGITTQSLVKVETVDPLKSVLNSSGIASYASHLIYLNTSRDFAYKRLDSVSRDSERQSYQMQKDAEKGVDHGDTKNWFVNRFLFQHLPEERPEEHRRNLELSINCFSYIDKTIKFEEIRTSTFDIMVRSINGVFPYEFLSSGYRSALSLLLGIIREIEFRSLGVDAAGFSGVILIDELDLHLHPTWQQVMPAALRSAFPSAQLIVTSHSPHMIQEALSEQVIALTTDSEGHARHNPLDPGKYGFKGWNVEEVLEHVMGLEDPQTTVYRKILRDFDNAIDAENSKEVIRLRDEIEVLLHPANPLRKLVNIQAAPFVGDVE